MFEHTNVGDEIVVIQEIRLGWGATPRFAVKRKVIRTTKTQIITGENERYRRDNGKLVGGSYSMGPDAFRLDMDMSDRFQKAPEVITADEFERLRTMSRRFKSVVELFFPKLEASHIAAMFRNEKLREGVSTAAQALADVIEKTADELGFGHLTKK
ncbi:TPA: hypothetical protein ACGCAJ_004753 [Serratia marcescens]